MIGERCTGIAPISCSPGLIGSSKLGSSYPRNWLESEDDDDQLCLLEHRLLIQRNGFRLFECVRGRTVKILAPLHYGL